ncbi:MAG: hypothetical protein GF388_00480 [Candidatus Aegiribacteria sp.]|nr:hypothetical protein [Candidatus Aegiribacteria sp.]MBD3293908.1 hypothetical protein [Candidatus Fermentibacteria bacterium]
MSNDDITGSLEDYIESIYRILSENTVARVRDIAEEMDVSPASVTPAMKRLDQMGLVSYTKRSYIELTDTGLAVARRTITRHRLLSRFLTEILGTELSQAEEDACAMEHHLSDSSMERLAAFFEFLAACPELQDLLRRGFGNCLDGVEMELERCTSSICPLMQHRNDMKSRELQRLSELRPGELRTVARISGSRKSRRDLIDLGFIQGTRVRLIRPGGKDLRVVVRPEVSRLNSHQNWRTACSSIPKSRGLVPMRNGKGRSRGRPRGGRRNHRRERLQPGYPLTMANSDEYVRVVTITTDHAAESRLVSMGINPGALLKVISASGRGPIVVARDETRFGIDRKTAWHVRVVPASPEKVAATYPLFCDDDCRGCSYRTQMMKAEYGESKTLDSLEYGETGTVIALRGRGVTVDRLSASGFKIGAEVSLIEDEEDSDTLTVHVDGVRQRIAGWDALHVILQVKG